MWWKAKFVLRKAGKSKLATHMQGMGYGNSEANGEQDETNGELSSNNFYRQIGARPRKP